MEASTPTHPGLTPFMQKEQYGSKTPNQTGLGNIDLNNRQIYLDLANMKGNVFGHPEIRTENSSTVNDGLGFVNIPTVVNGQQYSLEDAIMNYKLTGRHLGKFNGDGSMTPWKEAADAANNVHLRQQEQYVGGNNGL